MAAKIRKSNSECLRKDKITKLKTGNVPFRCLSFEFLSTFGFQFSGFSFGAPAILHPLPSTPRGPRNNQKPATPTSCARPPPRLQNGIQQNQRLAPRFAHSRCDCRGDAEMVAFADLLFLTSHRHDAAAANDGDGTEAVGTQLQAAWRDAGDRQFQPPGASAVGRLRRD